MGWFERVTLKRVYYHIVRWITGPDSMHETGCSGLVHWDDPGGWDWEGGGRAVLDGEHMCACGWLIHVNVWQKPLQYCKIISLQLKLIN